MPNRNKQAGSRFEYEYLKDLEKVFGYRFYASVGPIWRNSEFEGTPCRPRSHAPIDAMWLDEEGIHFVQNKYSRNGYPDISVKEFLDLVLFAMDVEHCATVELASKTARKKTLIWRFRNSYVD